MPQQVVLYRILVASPSDVVKERKAIPDVVNAWNAVNSLNRAMVLEPVLWETHSYPEFGDRPQAIVNRQLVEACDVLVGVFWTRLGTPTGAADSGTVEEIEKFLKAGKPVLLYFSSAPVVLDSVDQDQYKRLSEFKKKCKEKALIFEYRSINDLREQLNRHLTSTIDKIHAGSTENASGSAVRGENSQVSDLLMFKSEFEAFLRRLEAEWNTERDSEPRNIDGGKLILEVACSEILDFRAQVVSDPSGQLSQTLEEAATRAKAIQRHMLHMDGGRSFTQFWLEGNKIIDLLKRIPVEINKVLGSGQ